ncbi:MAG TPA: DUF1080 domain-containing protein [Bryobacteraceae bacterium]|nr:DUF1080 domain-containing protein [Bryobacteraceae bacterium]
MRISTLTLLAGLALPALAQTAPAQPAAPPKIQTLLITGQNTVGHDWRVVSPILKKALEDTGRFEVRVNEDFRGAGPETLASYDLVVINYYENKDKKWWWGDRAQQALIDFSKSGKGVVIFHFAVAAFEGWTEYEQMCGGNWRPNNGHHSPSHDFEVDIKDRTHPITQGLRAKLRQPYDELYANLKWQPAGSYHVLATAYDDHKLYAGKARQPIPGDGIDQPMFWTTQMGQGKVFVTVLGHDLGAASTPLNKITLVRGAEWAATGKVTIPIPPALAEGGKDDAQAKVVTPGTGSAPPSDAVVLFNGKDLKGWVHSKDASPAKWKAQKGEMVTVTYTGSIQTEQKFRDVQMHLEFKVPPMPNHKGQLRGNSGVYLQGLNEVQIIDGQNNPTYATGQLGGIYDEHAPLANPSRPAGQWQSYDIIYHATKCSERNVPQSDARMTVLLNGVLIQDNVPVRYKKGMCEPGPLLLQDHSGFKDAPVTEMRFRNIWVRPLN